MSGPRGGHGRWMAGRQVAGRQMAEAQHPHRRDGSVCVWRVTQKYVYVIPSLSTTVIYLHIAL